MSIKSGMVALVLAGTSTAAMAHPVYVDNDGDNDWDDRPTQPVQQIPPAAQPPYAQPPVYQPPSYSPPIINQGPITFGTQLRFGNSERAYLPVNVGNRVRNLTVTANSGRVYVRKVVVQFANGQEQTINGLHQNLTPGQSFTLDLEGGYRSVRRVVVFGRDLNLNPWQQQNQWGRRPVNYMRVLSTFSVTGC
jgi:hypothetical protein